MDIDIQLLNLMVSKPGICPICLADHAPNAPHHQNSLYYRCTFFGEYGRWPTWEDAISHCTSKDGVLID